MSQNLGAPPEKKFGKTKIQKLAQNLAGGFRAWLCHEFLLCFLFTFSLDYVSGRLWRYRHKLTVSNTVTGVKA